MVETHSNITTAPADQSENFMIILLNREKKLKLKDEKRKTKNEKRKMKDELTRKRKKKQGPGWCVVAKVVLSKASVVMALLERYVTRKVLGK